MLKVQVLYKVSMYETDWTMTEEEYSEFIASTQGLPRPMTQKTDPVALEDIPWHGAKPPSLVKDQEIARLCKLLQERDTTIEEMNTVFQDRSDGRIIELEKDLNRMREERDEVGKRFNQFSKEKHKLEEELKAVTLKAKGMVENAEWRDFLDQPAWRHKDPKDVEIVPETPEIVPIVPEKVQEMPKKTKIEPDDKFKAPSSLSTSGKKPGRQGRDYSRHLKMLDKNDPVNDIVKALMEDFNLTKATAQSTYNNIKRTQERRKVNQNLAESKENVSTIPSNPVTIVKPSNSRIPRNLREEIACMPEYESPINFKDAIITREYCNLYDIATLKAYYKETHENIKW